MEILIYTFAFIFGTIIGSFLNVVILRLHTGQSISNDGSRCLSCSSALVWYELIPVISFILQKGRCRQCGSKISPQYLAVELFAGIITALIVWKFVIGVSFDMIFFASFFAVVSYILLVMSVYDIKHMIIPDEFVYSFISLSLVFAIFFTGSLEHALSHIFAGIIFFGFFFGLWFISKGKWMGLGDAKISLGIGFLLGFSLGIPALIISFWSGAIIGIILVFASRFFALFLPPKYDSLKSEMPFGPFLSFGTIIAILFEPSILDIASLFLLNIYG